MQFHDFVFIGKIVLNIRKKVNDFFFYYYDVETDTTVPVPVENLDIKDEQELEFIYDDKVRKVWHSSEEEWL